MKFLKHIFLLILGITIFSSSLFAEDNAKTDKEKKENEDEVERDDSGAYWWGDDDEGKYGLLNHDTKVC